MTLGIGVILAILGGITTNLFSRYTDLIMGNRRFTFLLAAYSAIFFIFTLSMIGCASAPDFNLDGVDQSVQPRDVVASLEKYQGKSVVWGGVIINSTNIKDGTQLEILAYPLKRDLKPDTEQSALGRVIVWHSGYLETLDYAAGRLVTVTGNVHETKKGSIGDAIYTYPVVHARQLHLWQQIDDASGGRVHFGIGVMIH